MENKEFIELLESLEACKDAIEWVGDRDWKQVYQDCERGDWLMWLLCETNPDDKRLHHLVAGHQVNTVRHLMTDERSRKAVDVVIAYGEGKATDEELVAATKDVLWVVEHAAGDAVWAAMSNARDAAGAAGDAAGDANLKQTADIFRQFVPIEKFNIINQ